MPQNVFFALPFPLRRHAGVEAARRHNLEWVRAMGLVPSDPSLAWFAMWDMPALAAYGFPDADAEGLNLCVDAMAFFFVFDDQLDGPIGRQPHQVAAVCQELIDIVYGARPGGSAAPLLRAFADVWQRSRAGAPPGWWARAAGEWEYYFAAHAHEAINRERGRPSGFAEYLEVRRGIAGTDLPISLGERAARLDVPPSAFHSPQLRIMRRTAIEITFMCNDVYSLEKEEARGDMDNLVLVLEHEHGLARVEAIAQAQREVTRRCARFQELAEQVPGLCDRLGLPGEQRAVVDRYVDVMASWIRGYHEWEVETLRYARARDVLPAGGSGYFDPLITGPDATA